MTNHHTNCRNGMFCILPPQVLESIARHGSARQRDSALHTMVTDTTLRTIRAVHSVAPKTLPARALLVQSEGKKQRLISTVNNQQELPGKRVRGEGEPPSGDQAVDEAYESLGVVYDFFWDVYERNSIDDEGMPLNGTVHFGTKYNNAFWDGERMVFGDGDGDLLNRFTLSLDVIGHELTHGVTEDEARLIYFNQAGALNESMSDVFGSLVKQYAAKQTAAEADWLIGSGLFTPKVQGVALRSLKAPGTAFDDPILGKDTQPAHMDDFVHTMQDNGGVHINSGIPNRAFYLAATNIGGFAWEKAGRIWYTTMRDSQVRPNTGFLRFARRTVINAGTMYGQGSVEQQAVHDAWQEVGLEISDSK